MNEQETIADIIAEMLDLGKLDEKSTDKIPRSLMGLGLRTYADRLDRARMKMEIEIANLRKENAKLREALEELVSNIEMRASAFGIFSIIDRKTFFDAKGALAATKGGNDGNE